MNFDKLLCTKVMYTEKISPVKSVELSLGILDGYQNVVKIENLLL